MRTLTRQTYPPKRRKRFRLYSKTSIQSISDSFTISDTLLKIEVFPFFLSDSFSFSQVFNISLLKSFSQVIGFSDLISFSLFAVKSISDPFVISDSLSTTRNGSLFPASSLSFSDSLFFNKSNALFLSHSFPISDSIIKRFGFGQSLSHSLSLSDSLSKLSISSLSLSDSLSFVGISDTSLRGIHSRTILSSLSLIQSLDYERVILSKTINLSGFLIPQSSIKIFLRYQPTFIPASNYLFLDLSLLKPGYHSLVFMDFTIDLPLDSRLRMARFLRSHDPEPYLLNIEGDLWRGYLLNEEPRRLYFTTTSVCFRFELEYLGEA